MKEVPLKFDRKKKNNLKFVLKFQLIITKFRANF